MVCVCPVVRILLIFKIFFPTRNIFCWLNCPAVLGRWCGGENCSDMRGEVTREGAAAEQKSVVLAGAECGHETWDRCHFVYGLIVKYIESSDFFSAMNSIFVHIYTYFHLLHVHSRYVLDIYCMHSDTRRDFPCICEQWHCCLYLLEFCINYKMNENLDVVIVKKPEPS